MASIEGSIQDKRDRTLFKIEGPTEIARAVTVGPWKTEAGKEYWEKRNQGRKKRPSYRRIRKIRERVMSGGRATMEELGYLTKKTLQEALRARGETKGLWKNKSVLQQRILELDQAQGGSGEE